MIFSELKIGSAEEVRARRANYALICQESEAWLRTQPSRTYGGGVLDPGYGLGTHEPTPEEIVAYVLGAPLNTGGDFMGERWEIPPVSLWRELLRVTKPGGHIAVFASTSTDDLMGIGIRMGGWERRGAFELIGTGRLAWVQAQGMAKGSDLGKEIDEAAGADREVVGSKIGLPGVAVDGGNQGHRPGYDDEGEAGPGTSLDITAPATPEGQLLDGYRTDVAPKHEPILLFRAPLVHVTSAELRAATLWDHWHVVTKADRPHQRAEVEATFGVAIPAGGECQTRRKRPLHEGAEEYTELRHRTRENGDGGAAVYGAWVVLAETARTPFRPWKIRTAASNAIVYGTGALNAGACRVFTDWSDRPDSWKRSGHSANPEAEKISGRPPGAGIVCHPLGRACPDVWLVHTELCRAVGTKVVPAAGGDIPGDAPSAGLRENEVLGEGTARGAWNAHGNGDGTETVAAYECLATCPRGHEAVALSGGDPPVCACGQPMAWACCVAAFDQRVGWRKSGARAAGARKGMGYGGAEGDGGPAIVASEGNVSRYFPQDVPDPVLEPEAMPWIYDPKSPSAERHAGGKNPNRCIKPQGVLRRLWRLVLPPWEVGYDLFAGSGSGPAAALTEGRYVVGVDQNAICVDYARDKHIPTLLRRVELAERGVRPKPARRRASRRAGVVQTDLFGDPGE